MKRRLSLLLAVVMILGSFTMAFAAEESAEAKAGAFLKEVGVLEGINGDLKLEDNLRRQDMVVLIARLHGAEEEAEKFPTEDLKFTDFKDPYYRPIIAWAVANELIEGHTPERFGFNEDVTAQQYATVLLRALGYNDKVADKEGYAKALEEAKALGILENVEVENDTVVTRGQMAAMTFNALGVKVKDSDKTLAEKLGIEMPAPEVLEVEEVKADNRKEVKVVFNKAVDVESAEDIDNYTVANFTVKDVTYDEDNNTAIVLLEQTMANKKEYKINIKGVKDDKNVLDVTKEFTVVDNSIPEVVEVVGLGTKAIKVVVSEPVNTVKMTNFKLDGKTVYGTPEQAGRDIIIRTYSAMSIGEHELTVTGLEDYNGFKSLETKHTFEVVEDKEAPTVVDVKATLERVVVTFSEDVDSRTVNKNTVYWKNGGTKMYPETVERLAGNKYAFTFSSTKALPVYETTLYVEGVKDYSENKMQPAEIAVKASIDETRPEVTSVELKSDRKTVVVKFSKPVDENDAQTRDNYRILDDKDNKQLISKVAKADNLGKVYEIALGKELAENKEYTIKISGIKDNNKYANVMVDYEGAITVGTYTQPKVEKVTGTYTPSKDNNVNRIYLYFSKAMDLSTIVDPDNYLVKIGKTNKLLSDVGGEIDIIKNDGTVIEIVVEGKDVEEITEIAVLGVKDLAGKLPSDYGIMHPITQDKPELKKAVATAKDTVKVTFDQYVVKASAEDFEIVAKDGVEKPDVTITDVKGHESKTLTLTVKGLEADAANYVLKIEDDKVEAFNGLKVAQVSKELKDEIAPTLESAKITTDNSTGVVITLKFDEALKALNEEGFKKDLTVVRVEGTTEVEYDLDQPEDNKKELLVKITLDNAEKDSAYEITVRGNAEWITDDAGNASEDAMVKLTDETKNVNKNLEENKVKAELDKELDKVKASYNLPEGDYADDEAKAAAVKDLILAQTGDNEIDTEKVEISVAKATEGFVVTLTSKIIDTVKVTKNITVTVAGE